MSYQTKPKGDVESTNGDKELLKKVNSEIQHYSVCRPISFPRFTSNQGELIRLIDMYYLSQYRDGDTDALGQKKTFYNIVSLPVEVAAKELDIDTKHIRVYPEEWASNYGCILLKAELEQWMKLGYFGRELNKYSFLLSKYGHLILKKVKDKVEVVPLQNLYFRPDAKSLNDTPIIEKHHYNSVEDFKNEAESLGWEDYQIVISNYDDDKNKELIIYEIFDPTVKEDNYKIVSKYGNVLAKMSLSKNIYKGIAFEDLPYRLMGRGQVEKLFEEQIYLNRIANYKAEGLHWSSKNLFWARGLNEQSNLLGEYDNGDFVRTNDMPQRVDMREQNLSEYSYEEQRYEGNAYRRSFSTTPMTGEGTKQNVPFRSSYLSAQQGGSFYKRKREELGLFIKEVLIDWVIPEFKNAKRKEHKVLIENLMADQDKAEQLIEALVDVKYAERYKKGGIKNIRQAEVMKAIIREKMMKEELIIPEGYYDRLKYTTKIDITGEAYDIGQTAQAYQTAAQVAGQNPTAFDNPITRKIFTKWFEILGVSSFDMPFVKPELQDVITQQRAQAGGGQVGGSLPAPTQSPATMQVSEQQTV
jgi:hypothetical protein